jgi:hypothetical protein
MGGDWGKNEIGLDDSIYKKKTPGHHPHGIKRSATECILNIALKLWHEIVREILRLTQQVR